MKLDIFNYLEYRLFLKESFELLQQSEKKLSYRTFGKKVGFTSPNFLQMIIQGKRNLNSSHCLLVAKAFSLNKQETEYFQNLVSYDQSRSFEEKNLCYQRILQSKHHTHFKTLDRHAYEYFSQWYYPVVRELLVHPESKGNSEWIAQRIFPRITVAKVEKAKKTLVELKLVRHDKISGHWQLNDNVIRSDSETSNLALSNYHASVIQLAHDSLKAFPQKERDIRSVTVGLSNLAYIELKTKMEKFWEEIMEFANTQNEVESVYQVNLQLFPLTREGKPKDE